MNKRIVTILALCLCLLLALPGAAFGLEPGTERAIRTILERDYYQELERSVVWETDVDRLLRQLDSYTRYMSPESWEAYTMSIEQAIGGIGVRIRFGEAGGEIIEVLPETPAEAAGLEPGDILARVDGEETAEWTGEDIILKLRGEPGSGVEVSVWRDGELLDFSITRARIDLSGRQAELRDDGVGLFSIHTFGEDTATWFQAKYIGFRQQGMEAMVLDLRGNAGGRIQPAIDVAQVILPHFDTIVTFYSRGEETDRIASRTNGFDGPVVVLTDYETASAAEILTAAIVQNGKGVQVGGITFGKGMAQSISPLPDGGRLVLTTFEYRGPDGIPFHGVGLIPDYIVEGSQEQLAFALQLAAEGIGRYRFEEISLLPGVARIRVDGEDRPLAVPARWEAGRIVVPLRGVAEAMGLDVVWRGNGQIQLSDGHHRLDLEVGSGQALWQGQVFPLEDPVILDGGHTYVPVRFLARALDYYIEYDFDTGRVHVRRER